MEEHPNQLHRCTKIMEFFRPKSLQLVWNTQQLKWGCSEDKLKVSRFARTIAFKFSASQVLKAFSDKAQLSENNHLPSQF